MIFGYPGDDPCRVCAGHDENQSEPRFGYTVCRLHRNVPPASLDKAAAQYQALGCTVYDDDSATEVAWNSPTLNKGKWMGRNEDDFLLTVKHADRTVDPYLAGVSKAGKIIYTGLHQSLSSARRACEDVYEAQR